MPQIKACGGVINVRRDGEKRVLLLSDMFYIYPQFEKNINNRIQSFANLINPFFTSKNGQRTMHIYIYICFSVEAGRLWISRQLLPLS